MAGPKTKAIRTSLFITRGSTKLKLNNLKANATSTEISHINKNFKFPLSNNSLKIALCIISYSKEKNFLWIQGN